MGTGVTGFKPLFLIFFLGGETVDIRNQITTNKRLITVIGVGIVILIAYIIAASSPIITSNSDRLIGALVTTVLIALFSIVMGFAIGVVVGLGRISSNFFIKGASTVYVEILRGTPLLLQIFFIYYGLPAMNIYVDSLPTVILALGMNSGAYQAEIIRGGIQSIPKGQMEAARSSGMSYFQAMRHVILPQGFRLIIPPMTNEYVTVIKDSSLAYVIGVVELTKLGNILESQYFLPFVIFPFLALVYFTLTYVTSNIMGVVERKFRIPGYMESG
jgi:His/Glu/Gln/Arg/opine family amino acid ABC transporter permease subunit